MSFAEVDYCGVLSSENFILPVFMLTAFFYYYELNALDAV